MMMTASSIAPITSVGEPNMINLRRYLCTFCLVCLLLIGCDDPGASDSSVRIDPELLAQMNRSMANEAVNALIEHGPEVAPQMIAMLDHPPADANATRVLQGLAKHPEVQRLLVEAITQAAQQPHRGSNTIYCCLLALGYSQNVEHADFIAKYMDRSSLAAMNALAMLGGEKASRHLVAAFDIVPTDKWWILAQKLHTVGDPTTVSALRHRLPQVALPPNEDFPRATINSFIRAIRKLDRTPHLDTHTSFSSGIRHVYPYDGPGTPKCYGVSPLRDYYVRLPEVDTQTDAGRQTIFQTFSDAMEGPGFTIDGDTLITFGRLMVAPFWPEGKPYPTGLLDWLETTPHQHILTHIENWQREPCVEPGPVYQSHAMPIPENGLIATTAEIKGETRLFLLILKKTTDDYQYRVGIRPLDPLRLLIPAGTTPPKIRFTELRTTKLIDAEANAINGALRLASAHTTPLFKDGERQYPGEAMLAANVFTDHWTLSVDGAAEFLIVSSENAWEDPTEAMRHLRAARQKSEPNDPQTTHRFASLTPGTTLVYAVRMPTGIPVAGALKFKELNRGTAPTHVHFMHKNLTTHVARQIFLTPSVNQ